MRRLLPLAAAGLLAAACQRTEAPRACLADAPLPAPGSTAGMVRITGGEFRQGAAAVLPEEGPERPTTVGTFWIDRTEVTNAAFARFVAATGYRTLAERPLDPATYPQLSAEQRRPASLVFVGAAGKSDDPGRWWRVTPGADWRHPTGPGSSIEGKEAWPVVHVAYEDALAYARWLGRDLPTEAEWEYAARGGLAGARYAWGDAPAAEGGPKANTWQGIFPVKDIGQDGHKAQPAPVGCYPPNGYGLFDMAGNVWEWTRDWYRPGLGADPEGPPQALAYDPAEPGLAKHVIKGGSYLCSDDYCFRYRPAARTPGPPDGGAGHIGFRTVLREPG